MSGARKGYRRAEHDVESFIIRDYYSFIFFLSVCPIQTLPLRTVTYHLGSHFHDFRGIPL